MHDYIMHDMVILKCMLGTSNSILKIHDIITFRLLFHTFVLSSRTVKKIHNWKEQFIIDFPKDVTCLV